MGAVVHPRSPRIDVDAVDVGQAEVEDDQVGWVRGRRGECLGSGAGGEHLVVAGAQVDGQRAQDLWLVVDHQHPGHDALRRAGGCSVSALTLPATGLALGRCAVSWGAAGSESTMVRPPPGVSSGVSVAAHRLGQPAGQGEAEPDAGGVVGVAEALERGEDPVHVGRAGCRGRGR